MDIRYFGIGILFLSFFNILNSANFDIKKREDIIRIIEIIKSAEKMNSLDDKIEVLSFVIREIDFKKACPCIKKVFFKSLNDLSRFILDSNFNDLRKLESFLLLLYDNGLNSDFYRKQLFAIRWVLNGSIGDVPKFIKQQIIKIYQDKYSKNCFMNIGKCEKDLLLGLCGNFKRSYAVDFENLDSVCSYALLKKIKTFNLIHCKSEKKMLNFVKPFRSNSIFWINTQKTKSIMSLLSVILKNAANPVVLIDNVWSLESAALDAFADSIRKIKSMAKVEIKYDVIIVTGA